MSVVNLISLNQGGLMPIDNTPRQDCDPSRTPHQEIDYTPKTYTLGEHIQIFLKFLAAAGLVFIVFWLYESR